MHDEELNVGFVKSTSLDRVSIYDMNDGLPDKNLELSDDIF